MMLWSTVLSARILLILCQRLRAGGNLNTSDNWPRTLDMPGRDEMVLQVFLRLLCLRVNWYQMKTGCDIFFSSHKKTLKSKMNNFTCFKCCSHHRVISHPHGMCQNEAIPTYIK